MAHYAVSNQEETEGILSHPCSQQLKFLNKALPAPEGLKQEEKVCRANEIEEVKAVLRLIPIWSTCLVFAIVFAQAFTSFTKQGVTMDRSVSPGFEIPAASLQSFINLSIVILIPLYDLDVVPIARAMTRKPDAITMLQRIELGVLLSIICMTVAAAVERKRLETAQEFGLVDMPKATALMSAWWTGG